MVTNQTTLILLCCQICLSLPKRWFWTLQKYEFALWVFTATCTVDINKLVLIRKNTVYCFYYDRFQQSNATVSFTLWCKFHILLKFKYFDFNNINNRLNISRNSEWDRTRHFISFECADWRLKHVAKKKSNVFRSQIFCNYAFDIKCKYWRRICSKCFCWIEQLTLYEIRFELTI